MKACQKAFLTLAIGACAVSSQAANARQAAALLFPKGKAEFRGAQPLADTLHGRGGTTFAIFKTQKGNHAQPPWLDFGGGPDSEEALGLLKAGMEFAKEEHAAFMKLYGNMKRLYGAGKYSGCLGAYSLLCAFEGGYGQVNALIHATNNEYGRLGEEWKRLAEDEQKGEAGSGIIGKKLELISMKAGLIKIKKEHIAAQTDCLIMVADAFHRLGEHGYALDMAETLLNSGIELDSLQEARVSALEVAALYKLGLHEDALFKADLIFNSRMYLPTQLKIEILEICVRASRKYDRHDKDGIRYYKEELLLLKQEQSEHLNR